MKSKSFLTLDIITTTKFKTQKGSKNTVKIVHVTLMVQSNFMKPQEKYLLFINFFSFVLVDAHSQEYHANACWRLTRNRINCWINLLFLYSRSFIKWWTTDVTWMIFSLPFWALNVSVMLLSMQGQNSSGIVLLCLYRYSCGGNRQHSVEYVICDTTISFLLNLS